MKPRRPSPPADAAAAISEQAARWLARRDQGALDEREGQAFRAWLAADPRHAESFRAQESCWSELGRLETFRPPGARRPIADLPLRPRRRRLRRVVALGLPLAAAAVLVLATFRAPPSVEPALPPTLASTAIGDQRVVPLPDGSTIALNTDSEVRIEWTDAVRRVHLARGEAFFTVASHPQRPFVVSVDGIDVRALGTAFSVRRHAETVEVVVAEGRVSVAGGSAPASLLQPLAGETEPALAAGQRAVVHPARLSPIEILPPEEVSRRLAWQERRLEFGPTPLRDVVAEYNRYHRRPLVIDDAATGELSIGGSFALGDEDTLLRFLTTSFPIEVERRADATHLRARP